MLGAQHLFIGWALALSAAIWLGMVVFWLESLLVRIDGLQPAAARRHHRQRPGGAVSQGQFAPHANDAWLRAHLLIALAAYGLITIAAPACHADGAAGPPPAPPAGRAGRAQHDRARAGFPAAAAGAGTPAVRHLDRLRRAVAGGRVRLDRPRSLTGKILPFDHKTVFTLLSWATFGVLLLGRHVWGWRGRVALRWTLTGFGFSILAYTGSRFVLEMTASGLNVGKLLFWIVVIIAVLCVARIAARMAAARDARPVSRRLPPAQPGGGAEARRCAHCGIHLPRSEALLQNGRTGAAPTTRSADRPAIAGR